MTRLHLSPHMSRIHGRLARLYGDRAGRLLARLKMLIGRYGVGYPPVEPLPPRDQNEVVLITYADTVRCDRDPPLVCLRRFLRERLPGTVTTVHLLPFFPYSSDDGFSVIDYREVHSDLGSWGDVRALGRDVSLMFDLVLNHCSRRSRWFKGFTAGVAPFRDYFITPEPSADLSAVVRPRSHPLLTSFAARDGQVWVWTTFSADQVDLDFRNPDVLFEFLDILLYYIANGARILRLDAIAYLWKQLGTGCIHLEETHEIVRLLRDFVDLVAPGVLLLTETNVPHEENVRYFGTGDEAHLVYQFSLPPLLLHTLLEGDASALRDWAVALRPPPEGCAFLNFTASHDGVGVRPLEGLVPDAAIDRLVEAVRDRGGYVSTRSREDGSESPYELNITYFDALSDPEAPGSDLHVARFLCSQTVALQLAGIPAVYIHSLLATRNDEEGVRRTGQYRSINRRSWSRSEIDELLDDPGTPHHRVFEEYTRRIRARRRSAAFHPRGPQEVLDMGAEVLAIKRRAPDGSDCVLCLNNVTGRPQEIDLAPLLAGFSAPVGAEDLLAPQGGGRERGESRWLLEPYGCSWLRPC